MGTDDDPRADALARLEQLAARLHAHADEAAALRDELAALGASVEAIPVPPEPTPEPQPEPVSAAVPGTGDIAGARLVALDMVTSGVPRDEAVLRLAVDFPGVDVATLLDDAATSRG